jgi:riboflavin kinase/FMN adenylyltransferase
LEYRIYQQLKVFRNIQDFKPQKKVILTPGTFDGVHIGHQKILSRLKDIASENNFETVVLTFSPHPRKILFPDDNSLRLLNTMDEKIIRLEQNGIDNLIIYPFSKAFSRITALEYVRDFLVNELKIDTLVIGYDHQFGKNREGDFEYLKELSELYDFNVEEIPAQDLNDIKISSTKIRKAILDGDFKKANTFLGYNFSLTGTVTEGKKIGSSIGFPTANIKVNDSDKIIPNEGAYAVYAYADGEKHKGMLNIGTNPTVSEQKNTTIEVNIFDFDKDIYNKEITVEFIAKIREVVKFENIESLKNQLANDKATSLKLLFF